MFQFLQCTPPHPPKKNLNLGWGHFEKKKKKVKMVELQKFGSLGEVGCIAKIETLEVELKIVPNLRG
jgi:hypothetical protein